jgi:glycosyltransferase involved in cell wall biosynthesis
VIVSDSGASCELLGRDTGHAGGSAAEMAQAVAGLLTDPGALARSRVAARRRAEEFSWARTDATLARLRCALTPPQPAADAVP